MTATIHHGDCLEVLRAMPDNSVDAICCDPPYGLSNTTPEKVTDTIVRWAQGDREYIPASRGFMGATWDAFVPPVAVWDECLRVLKPGGHLVAFAGSRTQDLMGLAIRLAGFDIRENLAWLYGSGFPKSLDVGKAVDAKILTGKSNSKGIKDANKLRPANGVDPYAHLRTKDGPGFRRSQAIEMGYKTEGTAEYSGVYQPAGPATPEAERWQGWGTALKPGHEPIILARKPIQGTVASNTLTWGTGGLNIDKTRIHSKDAPEGRKRHGGGRYTPVPDSDPGATIMGRLSPNVRPESPAGRWPANVVLDPDTAKALDQQSGTTGSNQRKGYAYDPENAVYGKYTNLSANPDNTYGDSGGASRFFKVVEPDPPFLYAAKAPKKERPAYTTEDGQTVQHATVKPLSIMQWLVKLVTPVGGTVLDPFAGSGTTIEAAMLEGFSVIGIEREEAYLPLIQQRIDRATDQLPLAS